MIQIISGVKGKGKTKRMKRQASEKEEEAKNEFKKE